MKMEILDTAKLIPLFEKPTSFQKKGYVIAAALTVIALLFTLVSFTAMVFGAFLLFSVVALYLMMVETFAWVKNVFALPVLWSCRKIFSLAKEKEFLRYFLASAIVFVLGLVMGGHYMLFTTLLAIDVGLIGALIYIDRRRPHFVICELEALQRDLQETFWVCRYWLKKLK